MLHRQLLIHRTSAEITLRVRDPLSERSSCRAAGFMWSFLAERDQRYKLVPVKELQPWQAERFAAFVEHERDGMVGALIGWFGVVDIGLPLLVGGLGAALLWAASALWE
jgi:hypothetical protein